LINRWRISSAMRRRWLSWPLAVITLMVGFNRRLPSIAS
jgi:hypothetical protein